MAYERRIYAFRFATTEQQDDELITQMNDEMNHSRYSLVFRNCADFTGGILNFYFPRTFRRSVIPDARITTPKQVAYKLVRYARAHPAMELTLFEIPQIPGYRGRSRENRSISESLITRGYIIPLAFINPYLAGGVIVDYLVWGRYHVDLKQAQILAPGDMTPLTLAAGSEPSRDRASTRQLPSSDPAMGKIGTDDHPLRPCVSKSSSLLSPNTNQLNFPRETATGLLSDNCRSAPC